MEELNLSATASYWDEHGPTIFDNRAEWLGHPLVQAHHQSLRGYKGLEDWVISNYLPASRVEQAIGIGVGVASFELSLMRASRVEQYDLYDVSLVSLNVAKEAAQESGLKSRANFFCQDLNHLELPPNHYGLVSFISSLHHVAELEKVLRQLYAAMTPGGLLFASEYVGPNRFDFPEADTQIARQLFRTLDPALKCPWPELPLPNPADAIKADPTEAIHASEIIELVQQIFDEVEIVPLGGSLVYTIWHGLNHDALYETEKGYDLVQVLLQLDKALTTAGQLPDYFCYIIARKKRD